jgi:hypothetical protein
VVAVVAAGLGQILQFHIGGRGQPHRGPPGLDFRALKIIKDDRQVGISESQVAQPAQFP